MSPSANRRLATSGCTGVSQICGDISGDPTPVVTSINPTSAAAGSWVHVQGSNFVNVQNVYFGSNAASINMYDSTSTNIYCQVPAGSAPSM